MSRSCHIICLFRKKCKKARQIPKTHLVIRVANHMKRQGQSPPLTFLLYIKETTDSSGIQFLNKRHPVFSHFPVPEKIKSRGKDFICIHDHSLVSFMRFALCFCASDTCASDLLYTSPVILSILKSRFFTLQVHHLIIFYKIVKNNCFFLTFVVR